ncbi:hypothetical protein EJP77_15745 [Paenibacillus zeisoli]|uniref:Exosporium leader peptide n=1 Tax=Paenibacillus zeisoli TaxID=2496267 RepID=A0A3S1B6V0_9BACL|nr:hypothetical protein [Paenibacillus zeisoli]RUT29166.1 hypothetical protein EJP77_15745 [Paenibacillus zeisoli]
MVQVIDFGKSIAASLSQSINVPILGAPQQNVLSEYGLFVPEGGQALINATVGLQTTLGVPDLLFTILRNGSQIFTIRTGGLAVNAFNDVSFSFVDTNVPQGYYAYTLVVSITNPIELNLANVIGPVIFSGLSLTAS